MKPIWVSGHRKCGTTLLTNLFDGHKDIVNYGSDFRFIYAIYNGFDEFKNTKHVRDRILRVFSDDRSIDEVICVDFIESIIDEIDLKNKDFVWDYLIKLQHKVSKEFKGKKLMIKETSSEMYRQSIASSIDPYFIHMVRDPRDNWAAISAGIDSYYSPMGEGNWEALSSLVNRVNFGFNAYSRSISGLTTAKKPIAIKFENLVSNTIETVQYLCNFIEIDYNDILLTPTRNGKLYTGNSHDKKKFTKVSENNVGRFLERIPRNEVAIIESLCEPMMINFDYELITTALEREDALESFYAFYNQRYFYYDKYK